MTQIAAQDCKSFTIIITTSTKLWRTRSKIGSLSSGCLLLGKEGVKKKKSFDRKAKGSCVSKTNTVLPRSISWRKRKHALYVCLHYAKLLKAFFKYQPELLEASDNVSLRSVNSTVKCELTDCIDALYNVTLDTHKQ